MNNDIALWHLSAPLSSSSTIGYAALPVQGSDPAAGTTLTTAGWYVLIRFVTSLIQLPRPSPKQLLTHHPGDLPPRMVTACLLALARSPSQSSLARPARTTTVEPPWLPPTCSALPRQERTLAPVTPVDQSLMLAPRFWLVPSLGARDVRRLATQVCTPELVTMLLISNPACGLLRRWNVGEDVHTGNEVEMGMNRFG